MDHDCQFALYTLRGVEALGSYTVANATNVQHKYRVRLPSAANAYGSQGDKTNLELRARAGKDRPGRTSTSARGTSTSARAGANAAHGYLLLHAPENHSLRIVLRDEDGAHGAIFVMPDTDDQVRVVAWPDGAVGEEIPLFIVRAIEEAAVEAEHLGAGDVPTPLDVQALVALLGTEQHA